MPSNICSMTNEPINQGAVSKKTGHLFEKQVILKHLNAFPYCPVTNQQMSIDDLIFIQPTNEKVNKHSQSINVQLSNLRQEYDTLVLQTFYLRKNIKQVKQQLSHSLTANQAAQKVIGKCLKEKEILDKQLERLTSQLGDSKK